MIKVNGEQFEVEVEEVKGQANDTSLSTNIVDSTVSYQKALKISNPARKNKETNTSTQKSKDGGVKINSPMPGTIIKVSVNIGDNVIKGQTILILEAMKMENDIVAPCDGRVAVINFKADQSVNAGDELVVIE